MTGGRRPGLIVGALLALVAALWVYWPRSGPVLPEPVMTGEELQGAEFSEARIVGRRRGERQWVVDARRLREESKERVRAEEIDSGTLYRDREPYLDVSAAEAVADQATNNLVLRGGVRLVHRDGMVLTTEMMEWFADDERLVAPGKVVVERDGERVRAERMEIEWADEIVSLYERVHMTRDDGHWLRADRVDYALESEDVWVRGPFRAAIPPKGEEDDDER